jgi:hypothetical protein
MGLSDVEAAIFSRQWAHRWRWGCRPSFTPQEDSWYSFLLSRVSIARSCSCAANSFVCLCSNNLVRVQDPSAAAAWGSWSTPQERLNWKSTAHWNPIAAGQITAPVWLDTSQVRAQQCSFCRTRQHSVDFARQSNEHCLSRQLPPIDTWL